MKKFVILCQGYQEPSKEVMDAWMQWFGEIKEHIVDSGNPFGPGREVTKSGTKDLSLDKEAITGYLIINAESIEVAEKIVRNAPIITSMRVYEAMSM